ncbi:putative zinc metallopeptidase [Phaeomoniella chlamydospora]|uniref:Putative zinc metallopeptidase n=1 Tax=Phaeomoniella chlamydospora TaxID=158046 RepID=A0A0G2G1B5_PHACM|nr:putative zinc metallopeptidase [Phaeomoniella chlamydospora]
MSNSSPDLIRGVYLHGRPPSSLWDVHLGPSTVSSITPHTCSSPNPESYHSSPTTCPHSILLPALCHPHIHLDKCFILSSSLDPSSYSDLAPKSGTFPEALQLTSVAKSRFTPSDLYQRGTWLLSESLAAGVTSLRAFVEIDSTVEFKCLETAIQLKHDYADKCVIQICAFAQDPIFSGENGHKNLSLLSQALDKYGDEIRVLGTTPYVESSVETSHRNIDWAIQTALKYDLHLDFHLDYNLDETKAPMIWYVIDSLKTQKWPTISSWSSKPTTNPLKTIAVGHCTRLTLLPASELENLINKISTLSLPLTFIGLPTSDLYMMGRSSHSHSQPQPQTPMNIPRATLSPTYLLSLTPHKNTPFPNTALSINNISNPFTPSGSLDPLTLCSIGIGLYHAGTPEDTKTLYESVSVRARLGIGIGIDNDLFDNTTKQSTSTTLEIAPNTPINFIQYSSTNSSVAYYNDNNNTDLPQSKIKNPKPREKKSLQEIVWDPPFWGDRKVWFQR